MTQPDTNTNDTKLCGGGGGGGIGPVRTVFHTPTKDTKDFIQSPDYERLLQLRVTAAELSIASGGAISAEHYLQFLTKGTFSKTDNEPKLEVEPEVGDETHSNIPMFGGTVETHGSGTIVKTRDTGSNGEASGD